MILHNYAKLTCSLFAEPLLCKRNRDPEIDFTDLISTAAKVTSDEFGKYICILSIRLSRSRVVGFDNLFFGWTVRKAITFAVVVYFEFSFSRLGIVSVLHQE